MACTPVMVRGMSSGDRTSTKMATALTLDMVHSHFCAKEQWESVWALVIRRDVLSVPLCCSDRGNTDTNHLC
jgi:hypothetical protein